VYVDANDNGARDPGEAGIAGVRLLLVGKADGGTPVMKVACTDANGNYAFTGLAVGTYMLKELQPAGYRDGKDAVGTGDGTLVGNDLVRCVRVDCDETGYIFGERAKCAAGSAGKGSDGKGSGGKGGHDKCDPRGSNGKGSNGAGSNDKGSRDKCEARPKGNNGVGNGLDPQPPGNPPVNDGPGTSPGSPGNRAGAKR
jgi:hypothetical protein